MPQAVQSLPYVAWILLSALAFGTFAFAAVARQLTDATVGYLRFAAVTAAVVAFLAWLVDGGLTPTPDLIIVEPTPTLASLRALGLVLFVVAAVAYGMLLRRPRAAQLLGLAGLGSALLTIGAAAFGWAPTAVDAVPLLVQLVMLSLVTGGSLAAILLGHWYLVTPKISDRPLLLQAKLLLGLVGLQLLLFIVWTTLGGGPGQGAFDAFSGGNLVLVVLRLIVSLLFPLVLTAMAWRTALTRSMESATGLLYINLAAVMAGTIGAAALYLSTGLLI
ncbi:MAG: hypothetical protein ABI744_04345 [Chloroflexota bacterium]